MHPRPSLLLMLAPLSHRDSLFKPDAVICRVTAEGSLLIGGARALLMQVAHPQVAQGVAEHSGFEVDPFGRLFATLRASYAMVFGSRRRAEHVAAHIRRIHDGVIGEGYSANDPELLAWVNATLLDTSRLMYQRLIGPLTLSEQDELVSQSAQIAELLGCPTSYLPHGATAFDEYMAGMISSIQVSEVGKRLGTTIIAGATLPTALLPINWLVQNVTSAVLPTPLAEQFGLSPSPTAVLAVSRGASAVAAANRLAPRAVRQLPARMLRNR